MPDQKSRGKRFYWPGKIGGTRSSGGCIWNDVAAGAVPNRRRGVGRQRQVRRKKGNGGKLVRPVLDFFQGIQKQYRISYFGARGKSKGWYRLNTNHWAMSARGKYPAGGGREKEGKKTGGTDFVGAGKEKSTSVESGGEGGRKIRRGDNMSEIVHSEKRV